MARLRCKNHKDPRWTCKDIALTDGKYNGQRGLFFQGDKDGRYVPECQCPIEDLEVVPEQE